jgi:hypothetical protein
MSSKKEHIENIINEVHEINKDKHILEADEFVVFDDLQTAVFKLQKIFERSENSTPGKSGRTNEQEKTD